MKAPDNIENYGKNYTEPKFWKKLKKFAKRVGIKVVYVALLLYYVLKSDKTSQKDKLLIVGALGYLILPTDLIPDFIPVAGFTDDFAAMLCVYYKVKTNITSEVDGQAKAKLHDWFKNYDDQDIHVDEKQ